MAQKSGYRTADRAVVRAGELVVPRQEEVDVLLADEDWNRPQTEAPMGAICASAL
jgi:hypothetical protein